MYIKSLGSKLNITLFLGAGASVQFGNPTTKVFKEQLIEKKLFDEQFLPLLKLKLFPDIEYVLQCLKEILELENNQLGKFLNNNEFVFEVKSLMEDVELSPSTTKLFMSSAKTWHYQIMRYIFETYKIATESAPSLKDFFDTLFSCIDKYSNRIDIGTTNYDLAVETFCNLSGSDHRFVDGFEISGKKYTWNPQVFQKAPTGKLVYLYKIHGSLNWRGKTNNLIKYDSMPSFEDDDALSPSTVIAPTLSPKDAL
jgi:hypothetical protein